ncbi:MAG: lysoplasmalogenase [Myxococcota bacterium]
MMAAMIVCITAVVCLLVAGWADSRIAKVAAKMSAASAFLAMALAAGALESSYGQFMLAGLVCCWIGDACLLSSGRSTGFRLGIVAFLIGHLVYAAAFHRLGIDLGGFLGAALVVGGLAALTLRWLRPHVPDDFRIPIFCYVGVISLMVAASVGAYMESASIVLVIGAVGFAASDLFVARERFVTQDFINSAIGLPAYFGSQMLLAYSVSLAVTTGA